MKTDAKTIKLIKAGLQERDNGDIAAHGWLDIHSIRRIGVADYQREFLSPAQRTKTKLMTALENGDRLPDIILGMRGQDFDSVKDDIILHNDVYVIDGLQRISHMMMFADLYPERADELIIGAEVRFDTNYEIEDELFRKLNLGAYKIPLSTNVVLRNLRKKHNSILTVYGLSENTPSFPLYKKVQWNQRMAKGQLITAIMLFRVALVLHSRFTVGGSRNDNPLNTGINLDKLAKSIGLSNLRANVEEFFKIINELWPYDKLEFRAKATQCKGTFLICLAGILNDYDLFWSDKKLFVGTRMKQRFSNFPVNDPNFQRMCASGTSVWPMVRFTMLSAINKGISAKNRLVPQTNVKTQKDK